MELEKELLKIKANCLGCEYEDCHSQYLPELCQKQVDSILSLVRQKVEECQMTPEEIQEAYRKSVLFPSVPNEPEEKRRRK